MLATLYAQQSAVDDSKVEAVTVTVDLGSATTVPDNFYIVVTRE